MRLPLLLVVLLALPAWRAHGQDNPIHHCIDAEGHALFTDRMCVDMHATPAPSPSGQSPAADHAAIAAPATPPTLCAATAAELRQEVADAFAERDANRLAGLTLWNGHGEGAVVASIRSLSGLMQRPLIDVTTEPDRASDSARASSEVPPASGVNSMPAGASPEVPDDLPRLVVQTASDDGSGSPQQLRFGLTRQSGCLWLLPPD